MAAETAGAAPSAAAEPKFTQFDSWDEEGNPVVSKKPEASQAQAKPETGESATPDASKETKTEDAADSAAKKAQEQRAGKRRPDVEERFSKLTEENRRLKAELDEAKKPKTQAIRVTPSTTFFRLMAPSIRAPIIAFLPSSQR